MIPPIPTNEAERLEALRQYRILDTDPEPLYDDIVGLAAHICGTPMATISLVDNDRQWFKSRIGLAASETPREFAFCAHAIMGSETMIVEDATLDARFADSPLVTGDTGIRFYMGAPLTNPNGHAVGALCVLDNRPRHLGPAECKALEALQRIVVDMLEQRQLAHKLGEALENVHVLEGLLPMCMFCKNIREDNGYWKRVEEYVAERSDAQFSHGICPTCAKEHFPDFA